MDASDRGRLDTNKYYPIFQASDAEYDGEVFVGVSSTGIYCRPVCHVKMPKQENCNYFSNAAAAEASGYRPCLVCRPELAPGSALSDTPANIARKAALIMDEDSLHDHSLAELAQALGVTDRHLRRLFVVEYGVTPVQYLQTQRLLLAKNLLTDTRLSMTEVAFAAGFRSIRRFNDVFQSHYRMPPSRLREQKDSAVTDGVTLLLGYRPPYLWDAMLRFLDDRAIPGVELVHGDAYTRTVSIAQDGNTYRGVFTARHMEKKNALAVTVTESLLPVLPRVLARIKHLFDLRCNPTEVFEGLRCMDEIRPGLRILGARLPGSFDVFEMATRAVLGQQITVKAARTLAARMASAFGTELPTSINGLTHTFPSPADICGLGGPIEDQLGPLGITGARARSIRALAEGLMEGKIDLSRNADMQDQKERLLALHGFGPWTVQYIAMRALGHKDAFPHTDYGVKQALKGYEPGEILALAERWRPWRAYATIHLWNSLKARH